MISHCNEFADYRRFYLNIEIQYSTREIKITSRLKFVFNLYRFLNVNVNVPFLIGTEYQGNVHHIINFK